MKFIHVGNYLKKYFLKKSDRLHNHRLRAISSTQMCRFKVLLTQGEQECGSFFVIALGVFLHYLTAISGTCAIAKKLIVMSWV